MKIAPGAITALKRPAFSTATGRRRNIIRGLNDVDAVFFECMGCFSCVQKCTKGLLALSVNPVYERLGNSYWTPEIIETTWAQAETAKIPVSGAGYRGKFTGPGFDSMWTDMSEIVRPTRDGIHGREYISTAVDIGRKPALLSFDSDNVNQRAASAGGHTHAADYRYDAPTVPSSETDTCFPSGGGTNRIIGDNQFT